MTNLITSVLNINNNINANNNNNNQVGHNYKGNSKTYWTRWTWTLATTTTWWPTWTKTWATTSTLCSRLGGRGDVVGPLLLLFLLLLGTGMHGVRWAGKPCARWSSSKLLGISSKQLCEWTKQVEEWRKLSHKKQWSECSLVRIETKLCSFVYMLVSQNVLTVNKVWVIICGASLPTPVTAMFVTSIDLSSVSLGLWSSVVTHFKLGEGSRTPVTETFR